jgi:eukaryotic-like serine/threonine-protein kinase
MLEAIELVLVGVFALVGVGLACRTAGGPLPGWKNATAGARRVGPYALGERIAAGAMGEVYRARHLGSGHVRALKLLSQNAGEREQRQFEREARAGARLDHPNTVTVHDYGVASDGTRYLAMELLDGINLEQLVRQEGPQAPERAIGILLQIATGLAEVHGLGLVHRDIKPQNILLCRGAGGQESVKLIDFGLVKELDDGSPSSTSTIVGTPLYIAPEALTTPDAVDARSDLYGLGAVAHFLLSGEPVFGGRSVLEACSHHLLTAPEPLSRVVGWVIGSDLERLVLDCLAKEPSARPADARELIERLERCADRDEGALPRLRAEEGGRGVFVARA